VGMEVDGMPFHGVHTKMIQKLLDISTEHVWTTVLHVWEVLTHWPSLHRGRNSPKKPQLLPTTTLQVNTDPRWATNCPLVWEAPCPLPVRKQCPWCGHGIFLWGFKFGFCSCALEALFQHSFTLAFLATHVVCSENVLAHHLQGHHEQLTARQSKRIGITKAMTNPKGVIKKG
jgi:hypothetical protein